MRARFGCDTARMPDRAPTHWECDVILRDGGTVHVRPASAADVPAVTAFFDGLSEHSTYLRFFSLRRMTEDDVAKVVDVDQDDHVVLLAELGDDVVALAQYDRHEPGGATAEVAFVVAEDEQGRGLGSLLLEHVAAAARERGVHRFTAETLAENRRMLQVFREAGYVVAAEREGTVVEVSFTIEPTDQARAVVEGREHRAESTSMARLLHPSSVAVVGASRRVDNAGHRVVANLLDAGFEGRIAVVNPQAEAVEGIPAHASLTDLGHDVDLVVVAVPEEAVEAVVREAIAVGATGVVVLSEGMAGAEDAAAALRDLGRRNGVRVVGPSSIGLITSALGLDATFSMFRPAPGGVGMLAQSSAVGVALLERARRTGVGVSTFVSVGDKADVSGNDLLQYWTDDTATSTVLLYLESFGNPHKFARLARRVSRRKPIVAVKGGRTGRPETVASSHTAVLTSTDSAVDALFRQAGVIRVDTLEELFDSAQLLQTQPLPRGRRVAIVGNSSGPGILAADACAAAGLTVVPLARDTRRGLEGVVGPRGRATNPVDVGATASPEAFADATRLLLADPDVDAVIVACTPTVGVMPHLVADAVAACAGGPTPLLGAFLAWPAAPSVHPGPDDVRIPLFGSVEPAVRALGRAVAYAEWRRREPGTVADLPDVDPAAVRAAAEEALAELPPSGWLGPDAVRALLGSVGVALPEARVVDSAAAAADAAAAIGGPVAVKALGPDLVHKSDVGGVALDVADGPAAATAYAEMADRLDGRMDGALVQQMAPAGVETIVGITHDPTFGPVVLFGLGGVATELMGDHAFRILPLTDRDAAELVRSLRSSPLLFGYRGTPVGDVRALEDLLQRVARLAGLIPELAELDLNPVLVSPEGVAVVDAAIRLDPTLDEPPSELRRTA